jgi:hypothetical protein
MRENVVLDADSDPLGTVDPADPADPANPPDLANTADPAYPAMCVVGGAGCRQ